MNPAQWFIQQWQPQAWFLGRLEELQTMVMWEHSLSTSRMRTILKTSCKSTFLRSDVQRGSFLHSWHLIYPVSDQTGDQESANSPGDRASAAEQRSLGISESCPLHTQHFSVLSKEQWQSAALGDVLTTSTHSNRFTTIIQRKLWPMPKIGKSCKWRMGWQATSVWGGECRKMKETQGIGKWVTGVSVNAAEEQMEWPWDGENVAPSLCCLIPAWQSF